MDSNHVLVAHEVTGNEWECPIGYLEHAKELGWTVADQDTATEPDGPYDHLTIGELRDLIDARNATPVEGAEPISKGGSKADLAAALIADDARRLPTS